MQKQRFNNINSKQNNCHPPLRINIIAYKYFFMLCYSGNCTLFTVLATNLECHVTFIIELDQYSDAPKQSWSDVYHTKMSHKNKELF